MTDYNGWTNWETWHTALLIDNDERMQSHAYALGKRCAAIRRGEVKGKVYNPKIAADAFRHAFSKAWTQTKRFARESWPNESLAPVNWLEIAESEMDNADSEAAYEVSKHDR